jgi:hypothetical protein
VQRIGLVPPETDAETRKWLKEAIEFVGDVESPAGDGDDWDPERGFRR